ncbi:hypothetical protein BC830DRAFT_1059801, partial [Chytriomyces sp. MP71]
SFGFDSHKRSNLFFLDDTTLLTSVGNVLVFINVKTSDQSYFEGLRDGGIGAVAVHPSRKFIALAEIYPQPSIFIFQYPSMALYRILRGGTTRAYSDIAFNAKGDKLASVGADPDYMLTVWNWKSQEITLKSKAFSQDVYKVSFAPENDGILTTSGMGHIKFWQMSATFTGLKLQGYLGKFGASELSDIAAFIQLPDGKVLSSTETGNMLLWDGGMIKCEIATKGKRPCHIGKIEVLLMIDSSEVFTAGEDGYVRVWDFETIDNADVTSETAGPTGAPVSSSGPAQARVFEMEFLEEFLIGKDVMIKNMIRSLDNPSQYLILDQQGHIYKLDTKQRFIASSLSFHSGGVAGLGISPSCHAMVSLGADGAIHLYDYIKKAMLAREKYSSGGSCLANIPETLDGRGCTVAAGFTDGVLRIISYQPPPIDINHATFYLQYAFKPHKGPIAGIAISPDGTYLATYGATDKTVFFFKVDSKPTTAGSHSSDKSPVAFDKKNIKILPIGFLEMEDCVIQIAFSSDNHTGNIEPLDETEESDDDEEDEEDELSGKLALIVTKSGPMFSARVPHPSRVNTQLTYQLDAATLKLNQWHLIVPALKLVPVPKQEEEGQDVNKKPSSPGSSAPLPDKSNETKINSPPSNDKNDGRIGSAVRKARGLCISETSPISQVLYLPGGYFLASVVNKYGEGEIRSLKFGSPDKSRLIVLGKSKFTDMRLSPSGKYLIAGTESGMTCVRQVKIDEMLLHKWELGHETYEHYSKAFNDLALGIKMQRGVTQGGLPTDRIYDGQYWFGHVHDSDRGMISNISMSFDEAFICSAGHDGGIFLFRFNPKVIEERDSPLVDAIDMDGQEQTQDIVDKNVYTIQEYKIKSERDREIAEAEQKKQAMRDYIAELRSEYLKVLANIELNGAPLPALRVDPDLEEDIEAETLDRVANVRKELEWISEKESIGPNKLKRKFLDNIQTSHIRVTALKTTYAVSTFRTLKLPEKADYNIQTLINNERAVSRGLNGENRSLGPTQGAGAEGVGIGHDRTRGVATKKALKEPTDSRSKLEARKALRAERALMWKQLMDAKPDDNYEDRRDVAAIRYAEAHMVIKLRDHKKGLVNFIKEQNEEVRRINGQLRQLGDGKEDYGIWTPEMDQGCYPEERYIVSEADIEALKKEEAANLNKKATDGDFGGFGGGGGAKKEATLAPSTGAENSNQASEPMNGRVSVLKTLVDAFDTRLLHGKSTSTQKLENYVKTFDQSVQALMHERVALEGDVKIVDMKLLLLYREWTHLKEFEKHDNYLAEKLQLKQAEKTDIADKIKECQEKLNAKKAEIEAIISQEKDLQDEFHRTLGDNNKYEEILTKVFRKKIKRVKKKVRTGDEEDEDEEEEEEEEEDEDEDFDDEDDENNEDENIEACPPDLDKHIWDTVLELREKKLDLEEFLVEIQKAIEGFKKENDSLIKKEKIIDLNLRATESEIQDFQTQKQRKLNELDVVVPLRLHQIQYLEDNVLPQDLSQALIFVNSGLHKLKNRIKELQQEKLDIRKNHKELKKMHVSLIKSRKEKQLKLTEFEGRAIDVQMLKFGQTIDLEKLERMGINRNADELREKLQKEDNKRMKELETCDRDIKHLKDTLTDVTRQNTMLLENLVNQTDAHHTLEEALNLSQSTVNAEYSGLQKKDIQERDKLITLVQMQATEIDILKREIEMLIRKPVRQPATVPRNASKVAYGRASGVKGYAPVAEAGEVVDMMAVGGAVAAGSAEAFGPHDVAGEVVEVGDE